MIKYYQLFLVCIVVISSGCASNARLQSLQGDFNRVMQNNNVESKGSVGIKSVEAKTVEVKDVQVKVVVEEVGKVDTVKIPAYADSLVHNDANGEVEKYRFLQSGELVLVDNSEKSTLSKTVKKPPSYMSLGYGSNKFSDECFSFHNSMLKRPDGGLYMSVSKCESPNGDSSGLYLEPAIGLFKNVYPNVNLRLALGYYLMSYEVDDGTAFPDTKDEKGVTWGLGAGYTVKQFLIGAEMRSNETLLMTLGKRFN